MIDILILRAKVSGFQHPTINVASFRQPVGLQILEWCMVCSDDVVGTVKKMLYDVVRTTDVSFDTNTHQSRP